MSAATEEISRAMFEATEALDRLEELLDETNADTLAADRGLVLDVAALGESLNKAKTALARAHER
jgi:hypothetical protein